MKHNVMIDLETMGKKPGCAILSIGAVEFDITTGDTGRTFYAEISPLSCAAAGLHVDSDTLEWWEKQSPAAKALLERTRSNAPGTELLQDALPAFQRWMESLKDKGGRRLSIWANDPTFDCAILGSALEQLNMQRPWSYWNERSCRTLVALGRDMLSIDPKQDMPFTGTPHHALDDAKHQAAYISEIYQHIAANQPPF